MVCLRVRGNVFFVRGWFLNVRGWFLGGVCVCVCFLGSVQFWVAAAEQVLGLHSGCCALWCSWLHGWRNDGGTEGGRQDGRKAGEQNG